MEVKAPNKKATVVQAFPSSYSTKKKIINAINMVKMAINLYSANKKALAPFSIKLAISNNNSILVSLV